MVAGHASILSLRWVFNNDNSRWQSQNPWPRGGRWAWKVVSGAEFSRAQNRSREAGRRVGWGI